MSSYAIDRMEKILAGFVEKFEQSGETSFDVEDALETHKRTRRDLGWYLTGFLEGMMGEKNVSYNFEDIFYDLKKSTHPKIAPDLLEPKLEHFRNIDLIKIQFRILFSGARMAYLAGGDYIERWKMYNNLFKGEK